MTEQDIASKPSADDPFLVIEAFLDGERIDGQAIKDALAEAAVRDHFVELLMVREAVAVMGPHRWSAARHSPGRRGVKWIAAAAAVMVCVTGGYVAGQRGAPAAAPSSVEAVVSVEGTPIAPAPTKVIPLKPGVNWTDSSGGQ
jgi:hypothetical protein